MRGDGQARACRWPEIPAAPNTSLSRHQARPVLLPLKNDRLPGKPARPDGIVAGPDGPAHGRRPGKPAAGQMASGERRAPGGAAMAKLEPAAGQRSRSSKPSFSW